MNSRVKTSASQSPTTPKFLKSGGKSWSMTRAREGFNFGKMSKTPKKPIPDNIEIKADDAVSNFESKSRSRKGSNEAKTASLLSTPRMEHIVVRRPQRNRDSVVIEETHKFEHEN